MIQPPIFYEATAADGSTWRILRDLVIADMRAHNEPDDPWPKEISECMIQDWLGDNAESISGWELNTVASPRMENLKDIKPVR